MVVDQETRSISYAQALNQALTIEMARDENVILMGEDIAVPGGLFTVTQGLLDRFGEHRVLDTPIAEGGFVGLGVGAAMAGLRPVVELMFVDFALVAADQLLNQATKMRFLSGDKAQVPLTIRTQQGIVGGGGAQHSQSLEAMFVNVPGLAVAVPSTAADAKGLLATAIRSDVPVLFIEHKGLYFVKGDVPEGEHVVPFGQAAVRRSGADVTIVSYSAALQVVATAAEELSSDGIEAEVIDLRTLVPLDYATIRESAGKTGRLVVVHESHLNAGVGAEIVARVTEECWSDLKTAPLRVAGLDMPIPYAKSLESTWSIDAAAVVQAARRVMS